MDIGEKIHYLRKSKRISLEELGLMVGVGKSTVRKWETGDIKNMKRDKIALIAKALNVTPAYLLGWEEENPQGEQAENDLYSDITLRMMKDEKFSEAVQCLNSMDPDEIASFMKLFGRRNSPSDLPS